MISDLTPERIQSASLRARADLLAARNDKGHWTGRLSTSALSTATAVMALEMVRRNTGREQTTAAPPETLDTLIIGGLQWLALHQNEDGGWGDTTRSLSNISTTMLSHAVFHATGSVDRYADAVRRAGRYIDNAGGVPAVVARYGKDKTFSVPILTHCALAGLVDWSDVPPLPFELACVPARFYRTVRLPVVSYALPALIAIGQVRHHFRPTRNPITRQLRNLSRRRSLDVLERIQPPNGGFLEATPLTSFVTMSLAGMGLSDHPVTCLGARFIIQSVRDDGSWPIDTNLATWVTTLSVNALGDDLPAEDREPIVRWLHAQQYTEVHPYTNAQPGGWSWTDLPGGVPDADDTPGAILAMSELLRKEFDAELDPRLHRSSVTDHEPETTLRESGRPASGPWNTGQSIIHGTDWLLNLQNRNGGWPTFCRGWGKLPFDRSSPDITAHVLRALARVFRGLMQQNTVTRGILLGLLGAWGGNWITPAAMPRGLGFRIPNAIGRGFRYLARNQHPDGFWLPLWFGNQHAPGEINPTYGTAKVLAAYRDCGLFDQGPAQRGLEWLRNHQNSDGGWGAGPGTPSSVEETALATEVLLSAHPRSVAEGSPPGDPQPFTLDDESLEVASRGLLWLIERVEDGTCGEATPIGFYFAKLWYFEDLYPLIFTVAALHRASDLMAADREWNATEADTAQP